MIRRRRIRDDGPARSGRTEDAFHQWVLSLPWVVERPYSLGTPGVRAFAVECAPLGRRELWLLTGLPLRGIAVLVPCEAARAIEDAGWGRPVSPMPAGRVLVAASEHATAQVSSAEALVLSAYSCAMA